MPSFLHDANVVVVGVVQRGLREIEGWIFLWILQKKFQTCLGGFDWNLQSSQHLNPKFQSPET